MFWNNGSVAASLSSSLWARNCSGFRVLVFGKPRVRNMSKETSFIWVGCVVGLVAFYTGLVWVQCLFFALALGWTGGLGEGHGGVLFFK